MTRYVAALLVGLGAGAGIASAQQAGRFQVIPSVGVIRYDRTSALSSNESGLSTKMWASAGLSALYEVTPNLRAGFYLEGGRAETSKDYFPYALIRTGSNFSLFGLTQRVVVLSYGVTASVNVPVAKRVGPYLRGGIGRHSVFPDVQRTRSTESVTGLELLVGGGISYAASGKIGVRLELLDFLWKDWDRDKFNPISDPAYVNTVFAEDNPPGIGFAKPSLIHNLRLALGFTFTPSGETR